MQEVFAIPVFDQYLVFAPLRGMAWVVNTPGLEALKPEVWEEGDPAPPAPRKGPIDPYFLGIIPTRSCNMSCGYCGFGAAAAPSVKMELPLAAACAGWAVEQALERGKDQVNIHFFGGEPLLAWDVVETVVHRARWQAGKHGLRTQFEVSTNGLMTKQKARFVGDYFDVVVLSLDGWQPLHDRNRPIAPGKGSFEEVTATAALWKSSPVRLCLRMCVTSASVPFLEEVGAYFCEQFEPDVINFDTLQEWPASLAAGLSKPDPLEFAFHFCRARKRIESYGVEVVYAADYTPLPQTSFCPLGKDAVVVAPDGALSGCYLQEEDWISRGMDLSLGEVREGYRFHVREESLDHLRKLVADKPECGDCFCKWSCAGGCHVNHSYPGAAMDEDFCAQTRIITACTVLGEAGEETLAERLLADRGAMQKLATQHYRLCKTP
jgi:uncharacterized protein